MAISHASSTSLTTDTYVRNVYSSFYSRLSVQTPAVILHTVFKVGSTRQVASTFFEKRFAPSRNRRLEVPQHFYAQDAGCRALHRSPKQSEVSLHRWRTTTAHMTARKLGFRYTTNVCTNDTESCSLTCSSWLVFKSPSLVIHAISMSCSCDHASHPRFIDWSVT